MKRIWLYLLPALLMLVSCQHSVDDDYDYKAIKSELYVGKTSLSIDGKEQSQKVQITCNSYWTAKVASTSASWLSLSAYEGKGNGVLTIQARSNTSTTATRSGVVTVSDGINTLSINIQQEPSDEYLSVSSTSLDFSYNATTSTNVTINSNVSWTASADASWVKMSQASNLLTVKTDLNQSYSPRTATITIKGGTRTASITVKQKGASEPSVGVVSVSDITKTSATCAFSFSSSEVLITRYGVCYSPTEKEPTTNNDSKYYSNSILNGKVTLTLSGLTQNTTYFIRPYVVTDIGTTYGSAVQFTTSKINSPNEGDNPTPDY